ncbi:bifunctional adenosylcobinamide kinase/adenosylcobinamide-phosphate guanylyltransferase [Paenactinomyces guangxiensis]|uniref:Adenosylcobinamide kinase n=1 Tax=Paenactinomyces guangxiensis TaxID=1490290 RepID=A0A7W1WMV1_9BACL|nr:bifunctional adenosylcobinamide kinase/adenosylcobinamide-phosphate guanylyltransferase [Paenactinomyces guangxiensis]MBA4492801.1 bifunctional adenosylcobinamide kinase/adenosylcobinamide-phosphate guanylyltransferase [Paenactinomyces guangxiensis]MBH8590350.1 bifunctional adenosylcobinamide kinase/adenosylcobinamide-phosphate guanylyltransferase [Paenactinomyces guangxiensis]
MGIRLITGGVKSGKSRFAESLFGDRSGCVIYIATGMASDDEMEEKIARHKYRRPDEWGLVEEPVYLPEAVEQTPDEADLLIDSLSTWVSNRMLKANATEIWTQAERNRFLEELTGETDRLIKTLRSRTAVIVTDETGLGGVSMHAVARLFQEALGKVNQQVAGAAQEVWLVVSGIPWRIKG